MTGTELGDFAEGGLTALLAKKFCGACADENDCGDCPGFELFEAMEEQIGSLGIEYMTELISMWAESNVESS